MFSTYYIKRFRFFPAGLSIIWNASRAIWNGENFGNSEQRYDSVTVLTNVVLSILFFIVLMAILKTLGLSVFAWFFSAPILLLLVVALIAILAVPFLPTLRDYWRRYWSSSTVEGS
jgi:hypothetical protein